MKKRTIALLLACTVVIGGVIGGTVAWLTARTPEVTNTFTIGDINIELTEHKVENGVLNEAATTSNAAYEYVPGATLPKDPYVMVKAGSEPCYVFLRVEEQNNTCNGLDGKIIQWGVQGGWTEYKPQQSEGNGVYFYYRKIEDKPAQDIHYPILTDGQTPSTNNQVKVNPDITKAMRDEISQNEPKLVFKAAAVQIAHLADGDDDNANLAAAWNALEQTFTSVNSSN